MCSGLICGSVPKPPIEQGAHEREHITEERNDLRNNECCHPGDGNNPSPCAPSDEGVGVLVLRIAEKTEENETGRDRLKQKS